MKAVKFGPSHADKLADFVARLVELGANYEVTDVFEDGCWAGWKVEVKGGA